MRVRWEEDEKNKLAEWVANERFKDVDSSLTELLNKAQTIVLPEGRRRKKFSTHKALKGFDKLVKIHTQKILDARLHQEIEKEPTEPISIDAMLAEISVGGLFDIMMNRLTKMVNTVVDQLRVQKEKVSTVSNGIKDYNIDTGVIEKKKYGPVIGVVGMYQANFRALENRVKDMDVQLRFFDGAKSPYNIPNVRYMVCVPNKLPHTWQNFAKKNYKDNAYIVRGRVKEAEKVVRDIVTTGKSSLHF